MEVAYTPQSEHNRVASYVRYPNLSGAQMNQCYPTIIEQVESWNSVPLSGTTADLNA